MENNRELQAFPRAFFVFANPNQSQIHSLSEIKCDANGTLEVHAGENVTIHCTALPDVRYRWTKVKQKQREERKKKKQSISSCLPFR